MGELSTLLTRWFVTRWTVLRVLTFTFDKSEDLYFEYHGSWHPTEPERYPYTYVHHRWLVPGNFLTFYSGEWLSRFGTGNIVRKLRDSMRNVVNPILILLLITEVKCLLLWLQVSSLHWTGLSMSFSVRLDLNLWFKTRKRRIWGPGQVLTVYDWKGVWLGVRDVC